MNLRDRWRALAAREQHAVALAAVIVMLALYYVGVHEPLAARRAFLATRLSAERATLDELHTLGARAATLDGATRGAREALPQGQSAIAFINASATSHGLGGALRRSLPQGDGITVTLGDAPFDTLVAWLAALENSHGIVAERLMLSATREQPGMVSGNLALRLPR